MKIILVVSIGFAATGWSAESAVHYLPAAHAVLLTPVYLNVLVEEMRTNHPALGAAEARQHAAILNTNSVRTWADPTFKFGGVTASSKGSKLSEDGDLLYGAEQKLPVFGKEKAARFVAQAEAETETARVTWQFQTLRRDLNKAVFAAALADRVVEVGEQDFAWLDAMTQTTEERYRAGSASQVDVLRLQNERAKRADLLRTDASRRDHARLALNRLLNRDLDAPWPRLELPSLAGPVNYGESLVRLALNSEPRLRVLQREMQQAQATVDATRKSRRPDLSFGVEGRQYSGDGAFREGLFTLSLSLPWFNAGKYRSDLARDQARQQAVKLDAADYQLAVREEVHHLTVAIDAARREAVLYRDEILPRSQQALTVARENWLNNRGLFNDVIEARRMWLEAQLMLARAITEQYQALSELVLCCGLGDLEALEMITPRTDSQMETTP